MKKTTKDQIGISHDSIWFYQTQGKQDYFKIGCNKGYCTNCVWFEADHVKRIAKCKKGKFYKDYNNDN